MTTIINLSPYLDRSAERKGSVTTKRGSKKLYVDFYYHGVRIVKSTGLDDTPKNWQRARQWLDSVIERIENGTFVFAEAFPGASAKEKAFHTKREGWDYRPEPQDVLFKDYVERWRLRILHPCSSRSKLRDYTTIIDYWLLPHFGDLTFYQISGVSLKEFIPKLVKETGENKVKPLPPSRIRNVLIPLRAIWTDACEEHRWNLPDPFRFLKKHVPKKSRNRPEVFRFDHWMTLMANIDPFYRNVSEAMIMTGMIGSEIAGLRRQDVQGGQIMIQNSIVGGHEKAELKNEYRKRKLPITRALRERLDAALAGAEGEYLFTMTSGRTFDVDSFRKNPWTRAFKKAGLPYKVPYTMRHTFAAWALTLRMDHNKLVNIMGHGSKEMVYEVYGKYVEGLEKDAGKILEYFGRDFLGLEESEVQTFTINRGESTGESHKGLDHNYSIKLQN